MRRPPRRSLMILLAAGCLCTPAVAQAAPQATPQSGPPTVTAGDLRFTPGRTLHYGSAARVGLLPDQVAAIAKDAAAYETALPGAAHPLYPGAVVLAAHNGTIVQHSASGYALRYSDDTPTELPRDQWIPMRTDTIFDMASMSKLFTTIVALQEAERGKISLDATVASYLPGFAQNGKGTITLRQLLTHVSGLRPDLPFYNYTGRAAQEQALYAEKLQNPAGTAYVYSDLNLITTQLVLEKVTGKTLDALVRDGITGPLGLDDTGYNPPASKQQRIAATEYGTRPTRRSTAASSGARCTTRTPTPSAASPATPASSPPPTTSRSSPRRSWTAAGTATPASCGRARCGRSSRTTTRTSRRLARHRLRAQPALLHGRPVLTGDRRPHRLHGHRRRDRPAVPVVQHPVDQPGAPEP